ncbi:hypothetical protein H1C71_026118, partial [Ictidomys tridecemlineatus]
NGLWETHKYLGGATLDLMRETMRGPGPVAEDRQKVLVMHKGVIVSPRYYPSLIWDHLFQRLPGCIPGGQCSKTSDKKLTTSLPGEQPIMTRCLSVQFLGVTKSNFYVLDPCPRGCVTGVGGPQPLSLICITALHIAIIGL